MLILSLGLVNYFGVRFGGGVQVAMTIVKLALIGFVIIAGLLYSGSPGAGGPPAAPLSVCPRWRQGFFRRAGRGPLWGV